MFSDAYTSDRVASVGRREEGRLQAPDVRVLGAVCHHIASYASTLYGRRALTVLTTPHNATTINGCDDGDESCCGD